MKINMSKSQATIAAAKIADCLLTNGFKREADRLVIQAKDGSDLGGWCRQAVINQIIQVLTEES